MRVDDFSEFYRRIHGHPPFPWQVRLARQACEGDWPATLSLPTASGKTSAIDVAVFALAWQADRPAGARTARMRTAFVVDRRVVVDDAYEHAYKVSSALRDSADPLLGEVASRLRRLGDPDAEALQVALLRGGVQRDDTWARSPVQPTILVSTVDQVGSRLLFRGYGVSGRARPIHAGLLGIDTRIVLDEAHLSGPFEDTAAFVAAWQRRAERAPELPPPLAVTSMTATPRVVDPFGLTDEDRANPVLSARLRASKPARARVTQTLERDAAARAAELVEAGKVVGIVVNRVAAAREIFELLRAALADPAGERSVLLTGRARPFERDQRLAAFRDRLFARPNRPSVGVAVVATQTVEVGANLDFDHLITEIAPLDSLRQRFGRLNRLANHREPCAADILVRRSAIVGSDAGKDPVYGDRLVALWRWMEAHGEEVPGEEARRVDFGVLALDRALDASGADRARLGSEPPACPVATHMQVRAWAQTHPAPVPDPPVGPYLHGRGALDSADVTVVWRADLAEGAAATWEPAVSAVPPRAGEGLPLRRSAVVAWLRGAEAVDLTDLEGVGSDEADPSTRAARAALRWAGRDSEIVSDPADLRPGDVIVVPATYGGVDAWGWNPASTAAATDLADAIARATDEHPVLRLHPALLLDAGERAFAEGCYAALADEAIDRDERRERQEELAEPFGVDVRHHRLVRYAALPEGRGHALLALPRTGRAMFADEDEDDSPASACRVTLEGHSEDVEAAARAFASRCLAPGRIAEAVVRAAWLHDVGKADRRMQAWLAEGAPDPARPLAKSSIDWRDKTRNRAARLASGYPAGARHELQSVALAQSAPGALAGVDAELVLYLVGTHHGYGRGLAPVVLDADPIEVSVALRGIELRASSDHGLHRLGSGWAERFEQLQRAYGPWGLAWLEAVLRLADHRASEQPVRGVER